MSNDTDISKNLKLFNAGGNVTQGNVEGLEKLIIQFMADNEEVQLAGANAKMLFEELYERKICTDMYYKMIEKIIKN